jgi:uncharacterized HAD superfamily protein
MESKRRIGIDLDDVLADFIGALLLYHNETYGTKLEKRHVTNFSFDSLLGGTLEERIKKVNDFTNTRYSQDMKPIEGAVKGIGALSTFGELFVITSRQDSLKERTAEWIKKYFGNKFSNIFHSSNHYSKAENSGKTKAQLCRELGISTLIDDSLDYIKKCPPIGVRGILFGDYPWNQDRNLPVNVSRAKDWKEVLEQIK